MNQKLDEDQSLDYRFQHADSTLTSRWRLTNHSTYPPLEVAAVRRCLRRTTFQPEMQWPVSNGDACRAKRV